MMIRFLKSLIIRFKKKEISKIITPPIKTCEWCETTWKITRHHVKDKKGKFTGEIMILCRPCHDKIELQYMREGRIKYGKGRYNKKPIRLTDRSNVDIVDINRFNKMYPRYDDLLRGQGF